MKTRSKKGQARVEVNLEGKDALTTNQVAVLLQMGAGAIYKAIRRGVLPGLKMGNGYRFSKQAVLEALNVKKE